MIIIEYEFNVHIQDGIYINYGLVQMRIPDEYTVPLIMGCRDYTEIT